MGWKREANQTADQAIAAMDGKRWVWTGKNSRPVTSSFFASRKDLYQKSLVSKVPSAESSKAPSTTLLAAMDLILAPGRGEKLEGFCMLISLQLSASGLLTAFRRGSGTPAGSRKATLLGACKASCTATSLGAPRRAAALSGGGGSRGGAPLRSLPGTSPCPEPRMGEKLRLKGWRWVEDL